MYSSLWSKFFRVTLVLLLILFLTIRTKALKLENMACYSITCVFLNFCIKFFYWTTFKSGNFPTLRTYDVVVVVFSSKFIIGDPILL